MTGSRAPVEWDAETYRRVALPHIGWGREVIGRLRLTGDEAVLDAGCGAGHVTAMLAAELPRGRVIAVDGSAAMVERARAELSDSVEVRQTDLLDLELDEPMDAVFSSAVFHWIDDHERLFERLRAALRSGGRLEAQCGGEGNVAEWTEAVRAVAAREPYREHLDQIDRVWHFASPEQTERRLASTGFAEPRCWLSETLHVPEDPRDYVRSVGLSRHLDRLPDELAERFIDDVLDQLGAEPRLHYVRLNMSAVANGPADV